MRDWLISVLAGLLAVDILIWITLATAVAVLSRDEKRATRARHVLRMLLLFVTTVTGAVSLHLHQLGLLP